MSGPPSRTAVVGIDVGATLCKLARLDAQGLDTACLPSADLGGVAARVAAWRPARVGLTGGGATGLTSRLDGVPATLASEFEAWGRGTLAIAENEGVPLPSRCLLVSLGTGTSVIALDAGRAQRVGGSTLGGGTLLGLGRLLLGVSSFADLTAMAARGDRRRVDLLIGEVYGADAAPPTWRDLPAASFAKLGSTAPDDLAHALMALVGENVALLCGSFARAAGADTIVYGGSTLADNPAMQTLVADMTRLFGHEPAFLSRGAHCGAVGAAAIAADDK